MIPSWVDSSEDRSQGLQTTILLTKIAPSEPEVRNRTYQLFYQSHLTELSLFCLKDSRDLWHQSRRAFLLIQFLQHIRLPKVSVVRDYLSAFATILTWNLELGIQKVHSNVYSL